MRRKSTIITAFVMVGATFFPYAGWAQVAHSGVSRSDANRDWPVYGGQPTNQHYSSLTQINRDKVKKLKVAWTYDTGEEGGLETSPLIVGQTLYAYTPSQKVIALDAVTGKLLWKFDSGIKAEQPARGVAYWTDGKEGRILAGVMNYLYALDPKTGKPIPSFKAESRKLYPKEERRSSLCLSGELIATRADGTSIFRRSTDEDRCGG